MIYLFVGLISLAIGWYVGATAVYLFLRRRVRELDHQHAELLTLRSRLARERSALDVLLADAERRDRISRGLREIFAATTREDAQ